MNKYKILIISANLEIGGIERSLIGLLGSIDYDAYDVDLMLYYHHGPFLKFLPTGSQLLPEIAEYATFQRPIIEILKEGYIRIAFARIRAKIASKFYSKRKNITESGYLIIQRSWRYALPYLPKISGQYDAVISFFGPHLTATDRVQAKVKIGWIHTDYRMIPNDGKNEEAMWRKLDYIVAVSKECRQSFIEQFPQLSARTVVIENILSPELIRKQSLEFNAVNEMTKDTGITKLLSIGRFSYAKGIDQAVLVCRKLIDKGYNIRWYVIGYGPDEALIKRLIIEYKLDDEFIILGEKTNPYPYIRACDLFIQPSRYEGKAVTVREAQILGKPVLITNFPTAASQIEIGVDGHLCGLGIDGIVSGVCKLIDDITYRERIASTAASRDYSNKNEVEKIYALILKAGI